MKRYRYNTAQKRSRYGDVSFSELEECISVAGEGTGGCTEEDIGISDLTEEEKSDVIVLEITYLNGKQERKQIEVSLNDDGLFTAQVDTDSVRKTILNHNQKPMESLVLGEDMEEKYGKTEETGEETYTTGERSNVSLSEEEYRQVIKEVEDYYASTVFEVTDIKYWEGKIPYRKEYEGYDEEQIVYFIFNE